MKYKVNDRVRIKSIDWYNENKDEYGNIDINHDFTFYADRSKYCGKVFTIDEVFDNCYTVKEDNHEYYWADEMFEGLMEEEVDLIPKFGEYSDNEPLDVPTMTTDFVKEHGLPCPEGYQFVDENGNIINATKIVLEKKKKEYPKTYEECAEVLCECAIMTHGYKRDLLNALQKLLICRDAYWLIAGEEMGLGKPWEPDWKKQDKKYIISVFNDTVIYFENETYDSNTLLAFPTEEMRDAFYENFEELIEICKELLLYGSNKITI